MDSYTCYRFSPARRRLSAAPLAPPLRLLPEWSFTAVAYQPLVADGRLFVARLDGALEAYDLATARPLWGLQGAPRPAPRPPHEGALVLAGDRLLVRRGDELIRLDVAGGAETGRSPCPALDLTSAAVTGGLLLAIAEGDRPSCVAYDLGAGGVRWARPLDWRAHPPAVVGETVCVAKGPDSLVGLDLASGAERWRAGVAGLGRHTDLGAARDGEVVAAPIGLADSFVVPVEGHHVLALDAAGGGIRWATRLTARNPANLTADPDGTLHILWGARHTRLSATGAVLAERDLSAELRAAHRVAMPGELDVGDTHLYGADQSGVLFALHKERQEVAWTYRCAHQIPFDSAPTIVGGRLYQLDLSGSLYVFASLEA